MSPTVPTGQWVSPWWIRMMGVCVDAEAFGLRRDVPLTFRVGAKVKVWVEKEA